MGTKRLLCAFLAVGLYAVAWQWTFRAVDKVFEPHNSIKSENKTLCAAKPPKEIRGFLALIFVIFSSFAVWFFWVWWTDISPLLQKASSRIYNTWKAVNCMTNEESSKPSRVSAQGIETGYIVLSAVAKTVLHALLAVTSLAMSYAESKKEGIKRSDMADSYGNGLGIAFGVFGGVVLSFWILWRFTKYQNSDKKNKVAYDPVLVYGIAVRWIDYAVSAAIMWVVLSVSWGLHSYTQAWIGAVCHSVAMLLASQAEDPRLKEEEITDGKLWIRMHFFAGIVHIASAVTIAIIASENKTLGVSIPYTKDEPTRWYFEASANSTCSVYPKNATMVQASSRLDGNRKLPIAWLAVTFAVWSGLCHMYIVLRTLWSSSRNSGYAIQTSTLRVLLF